MLKEKKPATEVLAEAPEDAVGEAWQEGNDEICQLTREGWQSRGCSCYRHGISVAQLPGVQVSSAASH
jgi:hypothetical protein